MAVTRFDISNCPCVNDCPYCLTVLDACDHVTPIGGASVVVKQGGVTIASGTTDGAGRLCLDLVATGPGSYTLDVSKTGYVAIVGRAFSLTCPAGLDETVELTRDCKVCVTVRDCPLSNLQSGATVTVKQGGAVVGTCTTDGAGQCCITGLCAGGTYNVAASKAGFYGSNKDITVTCPGTTNATLTIQSAATKHTLTVTGCAPSGVGLPLPGATVTINGGSYTTDASGQVSFSAPAGTYTVVVSKSRFVNNSFSWTLTCAGSSRTVGMTVAAGYHCSGCNCADPIGETLYISDSLYGTRPVTWNGVNWNSAPEFVTFPGGCGCISRIAEIRWQYGLGCGVRWSTAVYTFPFTAHNCPTTYAQSGMSVTSQAAAMGVDSCPPAFSLSGTADYRNCAGSPPIDPLDTYVWQNQIVSFGVTE